MHIPQLQSLYRTAGMIDVLDIKASQLFAVTYILGIMFSSLLLPDLNKNSLKYLKVMLSYLYPDSL